MSETEGVGPDSISQAGKMTISLERGLIISEFFVKETDHPTTRLKEDYDKATDELKTARREKSERERIMERDQLKIEKLQQHARVNKELMEKMKEHLHSE